MKTWFPVWVAPCEPAVQAPILPRGLFYSLGPPLVQENQFFSPMSTYPESCVHVLVVTGECPIDNLMPNPVHVPSHIHIPTIPYTFPSMFPSGTEIPPQTSAESPLLLCWERGAGCGETCC